MVTAFREGALQRANMLRTIGCASCVELQKQVDKLKEELNLQLNANVERARELAAAQIDAAVASRDYLAENIMRMAVLAENKRLREKLDLTPNDSSLDL